MLDFFGIAQIDTLYVVLGICAIIIALVVLLIMSLTKIKKLNRRLDKFMKGKDAKSLEELVTTRFAEIDNLKATGKKNSRQIAEINEELMKVYEKTGIVKYDAFNEMGGKLSFALAMLDKSNNGYVINAMHSREGCYTYIKEIVKGESFITLGEEEKKALDQAIGSDSKEIE
ncbi:MAG: DUF4446 family protein [Butyrivibrio sp.]